MIIKYNTYEYHCKLGFCAQIVQKSGSIVRLLIKPRILPSLLSNISISTKEYNFYAKDGRDASINKVDFMVDATSAGQIQVEFYASTADVSLLKDSAVNGTLLGTGTLDTYPYPDITFEATQNRLWHPVYFQANGEVIQFQLTFNDAQMRSVPIMQSQFQLHAMVINAQPTSSRFQ